MLTTGNAKSAHRFGHALPPTFMPCCVIWSERIMQYHNISITMHTCV